MEAMKATLATLAIAGITTTAVLGFWIAACTELDCGHRSAHNYFCVASKLSATACPEESNALTFVNFHVNGLKTATLSVLGDASFLLSLALLALATILAISVTAPQAGAPRRVAFKRLKRLSTFFSFPPSKNFLGWLAIHENSPAVI